MAAATIIHGDARHLPLDDCTVDAVICDPPYDLTGGGSGGFMGKKWDATGVAFDPVTWREALRVLKPGGFLLAFGGMRTQHRLICAIEDAGFDIRDAIVWHFASGFPKSLAVDKGIDRAAHAMPLWDDIRAHIREWRDRNGMTNTELNEALGLRTTGSGMAAHWTRTGPNQQAIPSKEMWQRLKNILGWPSCELDSIYDAVKDGAERPVVGRSANGIAGGTGRHAGSEGSYGFAGEYDITAPATDDARRWQGFGTALKPASEIICVARKPLAGKTVAQNVLAYGCGALNIDGCRVAAPDAHWTRSASKTASFADERRPWKDRLTGDESWTGGAAGRWPSNVVFSHVALTDVDGQVIGDACDPVCVPGCPVLELDRQSGVTKSSGGAGPASARTKNGSTYGEYAEPQAGAWRNAGGLGDTGTASRFFPTFRYQAKAPSRERPRVNGVAHPTVKPVDLLRWMVKLVGGQPGSLILDMFAGSGSTIEAALLEGFNAVGVEQAAEYLPLIQHRIDRATAALAAQQQASTSEAEPTLFDVA